MRHILVCMLFVLPSSLALAGADAYSERWQRLSNEHYRQIRSPEGQEYERRLVAVHNTFWASVTQRCTEGAVKAGIATFRAVAVIDATGRVSEFLPMPNSPHLKCFTNNMVGKQYPAPPVSPFYELFEISLTDTAR